MITLLYIEAIKNPFYSTTELLYFGPVKNNVNVIGQVFGRYIEYSESLDSQNNTYFITHFGKLIYNITYLISTLQ